MLYGCLDSVLRSAGLQTGVFSLRGADSQTGVLSVFTTRAASRRALSLFGRRCFAVHLTPRHGEPKEIERRQPTVWFVLDSPHHSGRLASREYPGHVSFRPALRKTTPRYLYANLVTATPGSFDRGPSRLQAHRGCQPQFRIAPEAEAERDPMPLCLLGVPATLFQILEAEEVVPRIAERLAQGLSPVKRTVQQGLDEAAA